MPERLQAGRPFRVTGTDAPDDIDVPRKSGDPYGTRTRVFAVRGRRPGPLDEGANCRTRSDGGGHMWVGAPLVNYRELCSAVAVALA